MSTVSVLIPAYQPDEKLIDTVTPLLNAGLEVIIVNDGSCSQCQEVFAIVAVQEGVTLLSHEHNRGKGAALKTGFQYWLTHCPEHAGIVTADADGQHATNDILTIAEQLSHAPNTLHLGTRAFKHQGAPLRSRVGNWMSKWLMRCFTKTAIDDTQTGLRGIPPTLVKTMCQSTLKGYAFETDMLIRADKMGIKIQQHTIETLYYNNNEGSHFRPVLDSLKIYWVFMRYLFASLLSAGADFLLFVIFHMLSGKLLFSIASARALSCLFNFSLNRSVVFRQPHQPWKAAMLYLGLVVLNIQLAYLLVKALVALGMHVYPAKIVGDVGLFVLNFYIQKFWIFRSPSP